MSRPFEFLRFESSTKRLTKLVISWLSHISIADNFEAIPRKTTKTVRNFTKSISLSCRSNELWKSKLRSLSIESLQKFALNIFNQSQYKITVLDANWSPTLAATLCEGNVSAFRSLKECPTRFDPIFIWKHFFHFYNFIKIEGCDIEKLLSLCARQILNLCFLNTNHQQTHSVSH